MIIVRDNSKDQNCVVQIVTTSSRSASVVEQRRSAGAKGERRHWYSSRM